MTRLALMTTGITLIALVLGFAIGRTTAPSSEGPSADTTTSSSVQTTAPNAGADQSEVDDHPATGSSSTAEIPTYGTAEDRTDAVEAAENLGVTGALADPDAMLETADRVCYDLERLSAQNRSPFFATRVVWNESLAGLSSEDLAGFATTFNIAATHLCPQHSEYAEEVAYILGI